MKLVRVFHIGFFCMSLLWWVIIFMQKLLMRLQLYIVQILYIMSHIQKFYIDLSSCKGLKCATRKFYLQNFCTPEYLKKQKYWIRLHTPMKLFCLLHKMYTSYCFRQKKWNIAQLLTVLFAEFLHSCAFIKNKKCIIKLQTYTKLFVLYINVTSLTVFE